MSRREMVMRSRRAWNTPLCGGYLGARALEFGGTCNERTKVEAKGLSISPPPLAARSVFRLDVATEMKPR